MNGEFRKQITVYKGEVPAAWRNGRKRAESGARAGDPRATLCVQLAEGRSASPHYRVCVANSLYLRNDYTFYVPVPAERTAIAYAYERVSSAFLAESTPASTGILETRHSTRIYIAEMLRFRSFLRKKNKVQNLRRIRKKIIEKGNEKIGFTMSRLIIHDTVRAVSKVGYFFNSPFFLLWGPLKTAVFRGNFENAML